MKKIKVEYKTVPTSYPILIEGGIIEKIGQYLAEYNSSNRAAVISDTNVERLYGDLVINSLSKQHMESDLMTVPEGESSKSLNVCSKLFTQLIEKKYERSSNMIALGGGMVGDLAGFVAASYLRGVSYIQIPTSLLAQVDSSVGGKVAVNHPLGKNLIGAFYNPRLVLIDPNTLKTLPKREIKSGLGEVVKYGLIWDVDFFHYLDQNLKALMTLSDQDVLTKVISKCLKIKAAVVSKDIYESGLRKVLNFGHTIGHAIESCTDYARFKHGEAVILGMQCEAWISWKMGLLNKNDFKRAEKLLERIEIKGDLSDIGGDELLEKMKVDKKVVKKKVHFILLEGIGHAVIRDDISKDLIKKSIKYLKGRRT